MTDFNWEVKDCASGFVLFAKPTDGVEFILEKENDDINMTMNIYVLDHSMSLLHVLKSTTLKEAKGVAECYFAQLKQMFNGWPGGRCHEQP